MTDTMTYTCPYCRRPSTGEGASCPNCGAPVDITLRTTAGGWTELPPIADMARIQVGHSQVEVSGRSVPAAEWTLAAGEGVYFPHHVLLWQEPSVQLAPMSMHGAWKRMRAGLPLVMLTARGPGKIAFSHDTPGEVIALPLEAGASIDVCEGRLLMASEGVAVRLEGLQRLVHDIGRDRRGGHRRRSERAEGWAQSRRHGRRPPRRPPERDRVALPARALRRPIHGGGAARHGDDRRRRRGIHPGPRRGRVSFGQAAGAACSRTRRSPCSSTSSTRRPA